MTGHAADGLREQEFHLFVRELGGDVQHFPEEAALLGLCCGLRVLVGLGEATHVADAVPRCTDDGADLTSESSSFPFFASILDRRLRQLLMSWLVGL